MRGQFLSNEIKPCRALRIFNKIPVYILTPFILFLLSASLIRRAEFCGYRYGDNPVWTDENPVTLALSVLLTLLVLFLVYRLGKYLERFGRRKVLFTILGLSALVQALFILSFPAKQFADQDIVNRISLQVITGNYKNFQAKGYLFRYPNNVGITIFLSLVYRLLPNSLLAPKLLNVVFSTVTTYFIFRIYEEIPFPNKDKGLGLLILSGFFIPMILLNNLVYNDVYATTLFTGAAYYAVRFAGTRRWPYLALSGIFILMGDFLRQVGLILLAAVSVYYIARRIPVIRVIAFLAAVLTLLSLPMWIVNTYLMRAGVISEPLGKNSIPIHMWINIGMNEKKFGYWDDGYSYNIYIRQGGENKKRSMEIYMRLIRQYLQTRKLTGIARVYAKKNIWLWTEGTYQAEYYGIGSWGYIYPTLASEYVKNNQPFRDSARWVMHVTNLALLFLIFLGLLRSIQYRQGYPFLLSAIIFLGFICFYTVWEIKPRYIFPVYPQLLLMSYYGLGIASRIIHGNDSPGLNQ
jgi:hypothetical protein